MTDYTTLTPGTELGHRVITACPVCGAPALPDWYAHGVKYLHREPANELRDTCWEPSTAVEPGTYVRRRRTGP